MSFLQAKHIKLVSLSSLSKWMSLVYCVLQFSWTNRVFLSSLHVLEQWLVTEEAVGGSGSALCLACAVKIDEEGLPFWYYFLLLKCFVWNRKIQVLAQSGLCLNSRGVLYKKQPLSTEHSCTECYTGLLCWKLSLCSFVICLIKLGCISSAKGFKDELKFEMEQSVKPR